MTEHNIRIDLIIDAAGKEHAVPEIPKGGDLHVDDTVRYFSNDGTTRVEFCTPFGDPEIVVNDGEIRTLTTAGRFFCKCFLTLPNGRRIGWRPNEVPESGGEHDVRPRD